MKNKEIIMQNSIFLMEQGLLKAVDTMLVEDERTGEKKEIAIPEEIHTFAAWRELGFSVKKGEHAIAKFPIWKFMQKKGKKQEEKEEKEGGEKEKGKMRMTMAFFFTRAQVEPLKKKA